MAQHDPMEYLKHLHNVATQDVQALTRAAGDYGASFSKRGGVGHFMMMARKWDRMEQAMKNTALGEPPAYDIYARAEKDIRPEGLIDDIRDLRRYLLLLEAELIARGIRHEKLEKEKPGTITDVTGNPVRMAYKEIPPNFGRTEHPRPFGYTPDE